MCMMELATKTITAESTMGNQRAARETMGSLLRARSNLRMSGLSTRGYGNGAVAVKGKGRDRRDKGAGDVLGGGELRQDRVVKAFAVEVGDVLHKCHHQRMRMAFAR